MIYKKKYVYIALGALMVSGLAFGKFGADCKIQEVKAEERSITWNFSDYDWQSKLSVMGEPGIDITKTWDITVNGLNFYSVQKNRWNTTYIQLAGKGSKTDRVFTFEADYPGTLEITASNTGSSQDLTRNVVVQLEDDDDSIQKKSGGYKSSEPQTLTFEINSGVQKIYPDAALRIYKIKYNYMVQERKLESIYISGTATNLEYAPGEEFDPAGLKVMGKYDTGEDTEITTGIEWTFSPAILTAGTTSVDVTATASGKVSDPFTVDNLVVNTKLSDILNSVGFPTEKGNGWLSSDSNNVAYINGNNLRFEKVADSTTFFPISLSSTLEYVNGNYSYVDNGLYDCNCVFKMENNKLTNIEFSSNYRNTLNGDYLAPHTHSVSETHAKVEPTCLNAGFEVYYECDCGKYFSDADLTQEITNLNIWLAEGGDGYIAPLGHDFGGEVTYTWDGAKCTASWKCQHEGCKETQSETASTQNGQVFAVYDTYETCTENRKGHYVAMFFTTGFEMQETEKNGIVFENTALGHDFGGEVTYTWNEETHECTASRKCQREDCNGTQTETVVGVYVKDTDATTESNEKGHYEAVFTIDEFEKQSTAANSAEIPNTKLSKGLSGGAIAGISVGAVAGVALISYATMFVVYVKSGKGLKFLFKSFDWLKKLFKMKQ